jgi:MSHA biogenesis protein MshJ
MAERLLKRFEAMTLRERAFVMLAVIGLLIACWDALLMEPLLRTRAGLESELSAAGQPAQSGDVTDPRQINLNRAGQLQTRLAGLDAQLANTASGFVSADRMIQVLHDVLDAQGRLELVSIRNLPVTSLVEPPPPDPTQAASAEAQAETPAELQPPFVHAVEIVIDGQYSDILDYLATLEALPWKFRWKSLDLSTTGYPRNRVRIEIATLSLDSTWLGV